MGFLLETYGTVVSVYSVLNPQPKASGMSFFSFLGILLVIFAPIFLVFGSDLTSSYKRKIVREVFKEFDVQIKHFGSITSVRILFEDGTIYESKTYRSDRSYEQLKRDLFVYFERYHLERSSTRGSSYSGRQSYSDVRETSVRVAMSILGVSGKDSKEEVRRKYRELAKKYHPDVGGSSEKFIKINNAYELLMRVMK